MKLSIEKQIDLICSGNRAALAQAITIVESNRSDHKDRAQQLILALKSNTDKARYIGITGVPGVGKSTMIDALGMYLIRAGHRVAVLAVDPSSIRTGGSILGDKTRMQQLAIHPNAYIRPSPTLGTLGGVTKTTREIMILLEAAGYNIIIIETVGVGQSEVAVSKMVDTFVFLSLARTGDQLQGIKKGILELADIIVINKADGSNVTEAMSTSRELKSAMRLIYPQDAFWIPPVFTMSALECYGLEELWEIILKHYNLLSETGKIKSHRLKCQIDWMWSLVKDEILERVLLHPDMQNVKERVENNVLNGKLTPIMAMHEIVKSAYFLWK